MGKTESYIRHHAILILIIGLGLLAVSLLLYSTGTYDTGDGIFHYFISRSAFQHPKLYLDHWGKPLFTLLSSPFSQFGFAAINFYNICCNLCTTYLSYCTAKKLQFKNSWLVCVFTFFSPLFFIVMFSGLTEPTFALVLSFSAYLMVSNKFIAAACIVSLLPFARTEGFFILPIFALFFIYKKQYLAPLLLILGTLIYSIIGYFVFDDLLWVIHQNPYKGAKDIYGSGVLLHFLNSWDIIIGLPLLILFLLGIAKIIWEIINKKDKKSITFQVVIILGSFVLYFTLHSIFWWKGICGSLGLLRVMAAVSPMASIIALKGFNGLITLPIFPVFFKKMLWIIIPLSVIYNPFTQYELPLKEDLTMQILHQTADWIIKNKYNNRKIYAGYPLLISYLSLDVYNQNKHGVLNDVNEEQKMERIPAGAIVAWDAHFGPESKLTLNFLKESPHFKQIAFFDSRSIGYKTDEEFIVVVFEKID